MIFNLYCVLDTLAGIHYMPFQCAAHPVAIRVFSQLVNDPDQQPYKNPEDFNLMFLGQFDDALGTFLTHKPEFLISAIKVHGEYQNEVGDGSSI